MAHISGLVAANETANPFEVLKKGERKKRSLMTNHDVIRPIIFFPLLFLVFFLCFSSLARFPFLVTFNYLHEISFFGSFLTLSRRRLIRLFVVRVAVSFSTERARREKTPKEMVQPAKRREWKGRQGKRRKGNG